MEIIGLFIVIGLFLLNIGLIFKLWGMTNNIRILTSLYIHSNGIQYDGMAESSSRYKDKDGNNIFIQS